LTILVLEIGFYVGFSAMARSDAVGANGHVTTLEFSPEYAKIAEEACNGHDIKNVKIIVGDARES
jgi:predicted O-methyltransferase YrrM